MARDMSNVHARKYTHVNRALRLPFWLQRCGTGAFAKWGQRGRARPCKYQLCRSVAVAAVAAKPFRLGLPRPSPLAGAAFVSFGPPALFFSAMRLRFSLSRSLRSDSSWTDGGNRKTSHGPFRMHDHKPQCRISATD